MRATGPETLHQSDAEHPPQDVGIDPNYEHNMARQYRSGGAPTELLIPELHHQRQEQRHYDEQGGVPRLPPITSYTGHAPTPQASRPHQSRPDPRDPRYSASYSSGPLRLPSFRSQHPASHPPSHPISHPRYHPSSQPPSHPTYFAPYPQPQDRPPHLQPQHPPYRYESPPPSRPDEPFASGRDPTGGDKLRRERRLLGREGAREGARKGSREGARKGAREMGNNGGPLIDPGRPLYGYRPSESKLTGPSVPAARDEAGFPPSGGRFWHGPLHEPPSACGPPQTHEKREEVYMQQSKGTAGGEFIHLTHPSQTPPNTYVRGHMPQDGLSSHVSPQTSLQTSPVPIPAATSPQQSAHAVNEQRQAQDSYTSPYSMDGPGVTEGPRTTPTKPQIPPPIYTLTLRQQPIAARACGFGDRDRRVIDPPPILELKITNPLPPGGLSATPPADSSPSTGATPRQSSSSEMYNQVELSRNLRDPFFVVHCALWSADCDEDSSSMDASFMVSNNNGSISIKNPERYELDVRKAMAMAGERPGLPLGRRGSGWLKREEIAGPRIIAVPASVPGGGGTVTVDPSTVPAYHPASGAAGTHGQRRLMGTLVSSPFVGFDDAVPPQEGCFFAFPDLSCRTTGRYRLRFQLVRIDPQTMRRGDCLTVLATALSSVVKVYAAKDFPGMMKSSKLTRELKRQGCNIGVKKGIERVGMGPGGGRGRRRNHPVLDEEGEDAQDGVGKIGVRLAFDEDDGEVDELD